MPSFRRFKLAYAIYAVVTVLITGCLLDQKEPPITEKKKETITRTGELGMIHLSGFQEGAAVMAHFEEVENTQTRGAKSIMALSREVASGVSRAECNVQVAPRSKASRVGFLDVGKVAFGPAMQTSFTEIPKKENNQYYLNLRPEIAAGPYDFAVEGGNGVPAFRATLSMPDAIKNLTANGGRFDAPEITIKKAEQVDFAWETPAVGNDQNIVISQITATTDSDIYVLQCANREMAVSSGAAVTHWYIAPAYLSDLPTVDAVELSFYRVHLGGGTLKNFEIAIDGIRKVSTFAQFQ